MLGQLGDNAQMMIDDSGRRSMAIENLMDWSIFGAAHMVYTRKTHLSRRRDLANSERRTFTISDGGMAKWHHGGLRGRGYFLGAADCHKRYYVWPISVSC